MKEIIIMRPLSKLLYLRPFDLFPSSRFLPLSLIFLFVSYFNKLSMRAWHRLKEIYDVKFIIHAQTNKCTITMLFSCIYFVFQSLHLHVSVTPVTIFRVSYSRNTKSTIEITRNAWQNPPRFLLLIWVNVLF